MADQFQGVQSGQGLLKNNYDNGKTPLDQAMKKRVLDMKKKIMIPTKDEIEGTEDDEV